jgi:hypothetical protein
MEGSLITWQYIYENEKEKNVFLSSSPELSRNYTLSIA